jgi:hypothetical protein
MEKRLLKVICVGLWVLRCLSVVIVACRAVEVPTSDWSLVQGSVTECGVSECDRENSIMMRPRPEDGPKCQRMKAV